MDLALQTSGNWAQLREAAAWADQRGAVALALPDHYYFGPGVPAYDGLAQLAALAATTSGMMELVSLASPVTFRHPAVLAKMAATINDLSPGRLVLGIGAGWLEAEHDALGIRFGAVGERFDKLEEQLQYVSAALAGGGDGFDGAHYRLSATDIRPRPDKVSLLVGGVGPRRTPTLAGRYADEFNAYPGDDITDRIELMRSTALSAGRDPEDILVSSAGAVLVAEDRASYEERFRELAAQSDRSEESLEAHFDRRRTPRGSVDEVMSQFAALEEAGVTRFYVQSLGPFAVEVESATWSLLNG